jgi:hypothetical protein
MWIDAGAWDVFLEGASASPYGFCWPFADIQPSPKGSVVHLPLWLPLLVLAIPTAYIWHRDRRRYPPGHCQKCGYDLTGNESGKCPECGGPCKTDKVTK